MSITLGPRDLARYPFLDEARQYIRDTGFDWEEFNRPELKEILDSAVNRIEVELAGKVYDKLEIYEREIPIYLATLVMIKTLGMESLLRKYSLHEAMRAEMFLEQDLKDVKDDKRRQALLLKIFGELLKVQVVIDSENPRLFKVRVTDYLARTSHFHEREWKLVNRLVHRGFVYLDAEEAVRLFRNELAIFIYERVKAMSLPSLPIAVQSRIDKLRPKFVSQHQYSAQIVKEYPPCIKHAVEIMNNGENLPHSARVMLATYMLAIGKSVDEIVPMFQNAPDFNEKITRYQIEHLAGTRGSRTKYSVPSCNKLRSENLCFATEDCSGLINPVQFGRRIKR